MIRSRKRDSDTLEVNMANPCAAPKSLTRTLSTPLLSGTPLCSPGISEGDPVNTIVALSVVTTKQAPAMVVIHLLAPLTKSACRWRNNSRGVAPSSHLAVPLIAPSLVSRELPGSVPLISPSLVSTELPDSIPLVAPTLVPPILLCSFPDSPCSVLPLILSFLSFGITNRSIS